MASPASPLLRPPPKSGVLSPSHQATRPRGLSNRSKPPSILSPGLLSLDTNVAATSPAGSEVRHRNTSGGSAKEARKRSSSIVSVQEIQPTYDEALDQETLQDVNTEWVNLKGAWMIHLVLLTTGKVLIDIIPGMTQTISWTLTLQLYLIITFIIFHWVTGTPFSANQGAYDQLTFWEQIDHGAQYTPARKFLTSLPIVLFLLTTHYARYDLHPALFTINFTSLLLLALGPKLPSLHRIRLRFFSDEAPDPVSLHASHSLSNLQGDSPRSVSPSPRGPLTDANLKVLDAATRQAAPSPILEESEPATPGGAGASSGSSKGLLSPRKWRFA